ncbi:MAG: hypothetical protein IJ752_01120 [Alphaproteobacteria bacterium]|nr:hypothetical protein [Alphaproteobacteria bacterium]
MLILNINGPINAGKTTVSKLLVKSLPDASFIEVDDLLSDEEEDRLGLSMEDGWRERVDRLEQIIWQKKADNSCRFLIFAYPIVRKNYERWKSYEDGQTHFFNITLSPSLEKCLMNRGTRELTEWELSRIRQMYEEHCHDPDFSDLIIDNGDQTPEQTAQVVLDFLKKQSQ